MAYRLFGPEYEELGQIDFLLDQLARAVERGEVPRASYDAMSPRYLERRAELVAVITGEAEQQVEATGTAGAGADAATTIGTLLPQTTGAARRPVTAVASPRTPTAPARKRASKPVAWTTVLTILGAFLVVVAAAIFAVAIWDLMGVGGKVAFMGAATAAFYAAGAYARRIGLKAGGAALTAVASAMLLFVGWIVISGYNLQGPLPWAVVLLVCSVAYWLTELWLAGSFFGVVGASAQIGWWWLLADGLGWPAPMRFAGIAAVALTWQFAAEKGRGNATVGSLARALEWAAPVTALFASIGIVVDFMLLATAGLTELVCAGIVAAGAGVVAMRTQVLDTHVQALDTRVRSAIAAALQAPMFFAVALAASMPDPGWEVVVALVVMATCYAFAAIFSGAAFAVVGLLAEAGLVFELCQKLGASDNTTVLALAALAVVWGVAVRIVNGTEVAEETPGIREVLPVIRVGSFTLLVGASVAGFALADSVPLTGTVTTAADATMALGVLAAWWLLAVIAREAIAAFAGSPWAFYALAALVAWRFPSERPEVYTLVLIALAGLWAVSARVLRKLFGEMWSLLTRYSARIAVGVIATGGTVYAAAVGFERSLVHCAPFAAAAAIYAIDAAVTRSRALWAAAGFSAVLAQVVVLASMGAESSATVVSLSITGFLLGALALSPAGSRDREGALAKAATGLALAGLGAHAVIVALGLIGPVFEWGLGTTNAWYAIDENGLAIGLAVLGGHTIAQSVRRDFEPGYHAGGFMLVAALWSVMDGRGLTQVELYTTPLALYFVIAGLVHWWASGEERYPANMDVAAVVTGLGIPLVTALSAPRAEAWGHALWVLVLSLVAIGAGVAVKSRWYFFGGVASLALVALYRSWSTITQVWWLLLGLIGVLMLVVALSWERQRLLVADAREAMRRSFENWR